MDAVRQDADAVRRGLDAHLDEALEERGAVEVERGGEHLRR